MEYTVIIDGHSYDLPKKTVAVMEKMDEVLKVDSVRGYSVRQKFEKLYSFVKELVGDEAAKNMFGSDNLSEIDLSDVTLAVKKIVDTYEKPITDYDAAKSSGALDSLPIEKIIALGKAVDKMATIPLQGKR